jgi:hypothetical protein
MMREFINLGFNEDESGRKVGWGFDAPAAGGAFSIRFAQPVIAPYDPTSKAHRGGRLHR